MQNEKQPGNIKKYVTNTCGLEVEPANVDLFVHALTNYYTQHKQMVERAPTAPAKAKKVRPHKTTG